MIKHLYTYSGNGTDPYRNLALEQYLTEHVADDACILYLWQNQNTVVMIGVRLRLANAACQSALVAPTRAKRRPEPCEARFWKLPTCFA